MAQAIVSATGVFGLTPFIPRATFPLRAEISYTHNGTSCPVIRPCPISKGAIRWTVDDQAWAVSQGFFVARSDSHNRATFVTLGLTQRDQAELLGCFERHVCFNDENYVRLWAFIKQQDQWCYSGAWMSQVERYSKHMFWYKNHLATKGKRRSVLDAQRRTELYAKHPPKSHYLRKLAERAELDRKIASARRIARQKIETAERNRLKAEARKRDIAQRKWERNQDRAEIKARNSTHHVL